jgi:hypothetical protein
MNENKKPSIWCKISKENFKKLYPLLNLSDICPNCKLNNIECFIYNHRDNFKYFYAYKRIPYVYDDITYIYHVIDER